MVQIVINIEKRHLWIFAILIILFAGVGYVVGFGTSDPSVFGHTASEIQGGTSANPEYGTLVGALNITGDAVIDSGISGPTTVNIVNTGNDAANALVVHGDTIILPEGDVNTEDVLLKIAGWDFKWISSRERLCLMYYGNDKGYFDPNTGAYVPTSNCY